MVRNRLALLALAMGAMSACAAGIEEEAGHHARLLEASVRLHDHDLTLHLSAGYGATSPLLIYATGDAGWFGKDIEIFNKLVPFGYPIAGFSARDYVGHLGHGLDQETPAHLADDYAAIARVALSGLGMSLKTPLVLVGKSRGAGLAVAAASVPGLQARLSGVVAIALTREEEYISQFAGSTAPHPTTELLTYSVLPRLGDIPVAVIQSTGDDYLPAGEAQRLFGPDTPVRRFRAIMAADHNFDAAVPEMYEELRRSLQWVIVRRPQAAKTSAPGPTQWRSGRPASIRRADR